MKAEQTLENARKKIQELQKDGAIFVKISFALKLLEGEDGDD